MDSKKLEARDKWVERKVEQLENLFEDMARQRIKKRQRREFWDRFLAEESKLRDFAEKSFGKDWDAMQPNYPQTKSGRQ